jgi:hypothetical protein
LSLLAGVLLEHAVSPAADGGSGSGSGSGSEYSLHGGAFSVEVGFACAAVSLGEAALMGDELLLWESLLLQPARLAVRAVAAAARVRVFLMPTIMNVGGIMCNRYG